MNHALFDRNTQLQKEVASLKAYLKVAKKRLKVSGGHISKFTPFTVVPPSTNCGFCNLPNLISGDRSLIELYRPAEKEKSPEKSVGGGGRWNKAENNLERGKWKWGEEQGWIELDCKG